MKIVPVFLLFTLMSLSTIASEVPLDKGSWILEGSISYLSQGGELYDYNGHSVSTFYVGPSIGVFIFPNLMFGGILEYIQYGGRWIESNSNWSIGPTLGYYFNLDKQRTKIQGSLYPFIRGFIKYNSLSSSSTNTVIGGQGGILYMLSNAVAANLNFVFEHAFYEYENGFHMPFEPRYVKKTGNTVRVGVGITAFLWD